PARSTSSWSTQWLTCPPASRTSSPSPTQRIGAMPLAIAALTFRLTSSSSSWWYARRSECPTTTYWQPSLASIGPDTSPVYPAGVPPRPPSPLAERRHAGQRLALKELQGGAATRGDVAERRLVQAQRPYRRRRVAATDHGEPVHLGDGLGHAPGTGGERRQLE